MLNKKKIRKVSDIDPLMVRAEEAARLCSISPRMWYSMIATGQAPPSIKLGGARLWRVDVLRKWLKLNCPPIHKFVQILEDEKNSLLP